MGEPAAAAVTTMPGRALVRASWAGTALYAAVAVPALRWLGLFEEALGIVAAGLFFGGSGAFLWAYLIAIGRSRTETIGVGGLYFLAGCAPERVQRTMMAALAVQVAVGVGTAALRPYTALAFGVLVPMWGLGLAGLWGARHGTFPPKARPGT